VHGAVAKETLAAGRPRRATANLIMCVVFNFDIALLQFRYDEGVISCFEYPEYDPSWYANVRARRESRSDAISTEPMFERNERLLLYDDCLVKNALRPGDGAVK